MRRNGSGFGFFGLILFFMIFGDLIGGITVALMSLSPLGAIGLLVYSIVKGGDSNKKNDFKRTVPKKKVYSMKNGDLNKIDKKLANYFKHNISLPVVDDISLTTQSGKFTTADQLYLTYKDEKICKLGEFNSQYGDVYKKIMDLLLVFSTKDEDFLKAEVKVEEPKKNKLSSGEKYIERINELNNSIPQEEITNGLYQTCDLLKQLNYLTENKDDNPKVTKLYDYYLPILVSALEKYKKLADSKVINDDFKQTETGLIKTIVLINEALKTIIGSMQEDDYMNINADVSTLQSLLKKDGYGSDPFGSDK